MVSSMWPTKFFCLYSLIHILTYSIDLICLDFVVKGERCVATSDVR